MNQYKDANTICQTAEMLHNKSNTGDKVVVEANRVYDACVKHLIQKNINLTVLLPGPMPHTFVSGYNSGAQILSASSITPIEGSPCSRVKFLLQVPLRINALSATNNPVIGNVYTNFNLDLILKVPESGLTSASIKSSATVVVTDGVINERVLTCTLCVTIVTKIVAAVDLLLPCASYPILPECENFSEQVCKGVFELPIYPSS